jgi:hypothetical protein
MKLTPKGQLHKNYFGKINCSYWHIALSLGLGYATRGVNYTKKVL